MAVLRRAIAFVTRPKETLNPKNPKPKILILTYPGGFYRRLQDRRVRGRPSPRDRLRD